jgi:hypothetical protein
MTAAIINLADAKRERRLRARQERAIAHTVAYILATVGPLASPDDIEAFRELVAEQALLDRELFADDITITDEAS